MFSFHVTLFYKNIQKTIHACSDWLINWIQNVLQKRKKLNYFWWKGECWMNNQIYGMWVSYNYKSQKYWLYSSIFKIYHCCYKPRPEYNYCSYWPFVGLQTYFQDLLLVFEDKTLLHLSFHRICKIYFKTNFNIAERLQNKEKSKIFSGDVLPVTECFKASIPNKIF